MYSKRFEKLVNQFFKDHKIFKTPFKNKELFNNKTILITGGAGSIGSILALRLITFNIKKLVIIDNNEYSIFKLKRQIENKYKSKIDIRFLSILNKTLLDKNFKKYKFDYVYNCAAIKHVDIAEENKEETFRINVTGTKNLLNLSKKYSVKKFVFISSDKAFYPKGIMGKSKLLAEKKVMNFKNQKTELKILRFPNVITSSGSILEIIYDCINQKKIFELKNKNLIRYFIFKHDTLNFILKATDTNYSKKIIILNHVKSKKIKDLCKFMKSKLNLKYKITKLPKFEKILENYSNIKNKIFI